MENRFSIELWRETEQPEGCVIQDEASVLVSDVEEFDNENEMADALVVFLKAGLCVGRIWMS